METWHENAQQKPVTQLEHQGRHSWVRLDYWCSIIVVYGIKYFKLYWPGLLLVVVFVECIAYVAGGSRQLSGWMFGHWKSDYFARIAACRVVCVECIAYLAGGSSQLFGCLSCCLCRMYSSIAYAAGGSRQLFG